MRKGLWSPEEDEQLKKYISKYVNGSWNDIAKRAGLQRCGRSCRQRWLNHLRPGLRKEKFSREEVKQIMELQAKLGNRWSKIAGHLRGRTDNEVKNLWNTIIKRQITPDQSTTTIGTQEEAQSSIDLDAKYLSTSKNAWKTVHTPTISMSNMELSSAFTMVDDVSTLNMGDRCILSGPHSPECDQHCNIGGLDDHSMCQQLDALYSLEREVCSHEESCQTNLVPYSPIFDLTFSCQSPSQGQIQSPLSNQTQSTLFIPPFCATLYPNWSSATKLVEYGQPIRFSIRSLSPELQETSPATPTRDQLEVLA